MALRVKCELLGIGKALEKVFEGLAWLCGKRLLGTKIGAPEFNSDLASFLGLKGVALILSLDSFMGLGSEDFCLEEIDEFLRDMSIRLTFGCFHSLSCYN